MVTEDGHYKMGNKIVELNGNNITSEEKHYKGAPGLWALIMYKKPLEHQYKSKDMKNYEKMSI